ncbi:hypothetical protein K456DRAFT_57850 [Colletotrichum gloeosporioides 23]|nr:hypothetical protein K456DRAFT_57850 [Colletotrichum gloeosporioides 23]
MDSPEGSANDVMTAEIDCRVNKAVNISIHPLQDQMMQLLTALNRLMSTDRFIGKRKEYAGWSQQMQNKIRLDKRFISGDEDIWYYASQQDAEGDVVISSISCTKGKEKVRSHRQHSSSSSSEDLPQPIKDNHKYFNYNQISHIAVWCPRLKRSYPAKAKKVKKVKKAVRPKESSSSTTEELGSSETEESSGKE